MQAMAREPERRFQTVRLLEKEINYYAESTAVQQQAVPADREEEKKGEIVGQKPTSSDILGSDDYPQQLKKLRVADDDEAEQNMIGFDDPTAGGISMKDAD